MLGSLNAISFLLRPGQVKEARVVYEETLCKALLLRHDYGGKIRQHQKGDSGIDREVVKRHVEAV